MQKWIFAGAAILVAGLVSAVGCGGNVIVDGLGGAGGEGGTSSGPTSSNQSSVSSSISVSSSNVTSSVTTGPSTSFVSSSSTGPTPFCDNTGECGDIGFGCIGCAVAPDGPCGDSYEVCVSTSECIEFVDCLGMCDGDPGCQQMCQSAYPDGAQLYNELVFCVLCGACFSDCDGELIGCQ